jgi:hypothetical protein
MIRALIELDLTPAVRARVGIALSRPSEDEDSDDDAAEEFFR